MIKRLIILLLIVGSCCLFQPVPAHAFNPFNSVNCSSTGQSGLSKSDPHNPGNSAVCADSTNSDNTTTDPLLTKMKEITNLIAYIAGVAAIIVIMISAIRFITSGSDISTNTRTDNDVESARHTLANAVIGLVVIVLAHTIIVYVINRL